MLPKRRLRVLLLLFVALLFAASQDRYLMRRMLHGGVGRGKVIWQSSLDAATHQAGRLKRPLYVEFSATWCGPCQNMLQETFTDPDVARRLNDAFVPVLIDIDKQPAVAARFGVGAIPDGAFLAPDGRELVRAIGYHDADEFLTLTEKALKANSVLPPPPKGAATTLFSGSTAPMPPRPPMPGLPLGFP